MPSRFLHQANRRAARTADGHDHLRSAVSPSRRRLDPNVWPHFLFEAAHRVDPDEVAAAYGALDEWRRYEPEVDLYVSPCTAIDLPPEDADELEIRLPLSSFLRWVNTTGWAGLAIGNLQLVAPHDETVLAAGLAWVRG